MTRSEQKRFFAVAALTLTVNSIVAYYAVAQSPDPQQLLERADANGDGDISWEEVIALRSESFDQLDRNGDGVISADDSPARPFAARFNEAFEQIQANFDGDRDGQVTRDEMLNGPAPVFERGDVNEDGILSGEEIAQLAPENAPF